MSWLSKFVFDPIKAAAARALTSSNPAAVTVGQAATDAIAKVTAAGQVEVAQLNQAAQSVMGQQHPVIGALESGLQEVVDAAITAFIPAPAILAGPTTGLANAALDFMEQHALTYLSALFHHAKSQVPPAQPANPSQPSG